MTLSATHATTRNVYSSCQFMPYAHVHEKPQHQSVTSELCVSTLTVMFTASSSYAVTLDTSINITRLIGLAANNPYHLNRKPHTPVLISWYTVTQTEKCRITYPTSPLKNITGVLTESVNSIWNSIDM